MDPQHTQHPLERKQTNRRCTMNNVEMELFNKGGMMNMIRAFSSVQEQKYNDAVTRNEDLLAVTMKSRPSTKTAKKRARRPDCEVLETARAKFETQREKIRKCEQGMKNAEDKMWKLLYSTAASIMSGWCSHMFAMEQHKKMEARALSVYQGAQSPQIHKVFPWMNQKLIVFSPLNWKVLACTNTAMRQVVRKMTTKNEDGKVIWKTFY